MRSKPKNNARLIFSAESVGWAMKNLRIGMYEPGVSPFCHVVLLERRLCNSHGSPGTGTAPPVLPDWSRAWCRDRRTTLEPENIGRAHPRHLRTPDSRPRCSSHQ